MSSFSETIALQSHISERSMDWHDTMARYRRFFEDAILRRDLSFFHDNLPDSSPAADWFLSLSEDSALIAKFHLASMVSFCTDLSVDRVFPEPWLTASRTTASACWQKAAARPSW